MHIVVIWDLFSVIMLSKPLKEISSFSFFYLKKLTIRWLVDCPVILSSSCVFNHVNHDPQHSTSHLQVWTWFSLLAPQANLTIWLMHMGWLISKCICKFISVGDWHFKQFAHRSIYQIHSRLIMQSGRNRTQWTWHTAQYLVYRMIAIDLFTWKEPKDFNQLIMLKEICYSHRLDKFWCICIVN